MIKKGLFFLFIFWVLPMGPAQSRPKTKLWSFWNKIGSNNQNIDHGPWDTILKKYLVVNEEEVYLFHYSKVSQKDKELLTNYLKGLEKTPIRSYSKAQQYPYWFNLYNALTVKVILDHYPVNSIRDIDISPGWFSNGPWKKKLLNIEGQKVSLDDIEHRILRPIWKDPRIQYGVNCASIGCPNLMPHAFTALNTDKLLNLGAKNFINHPRGARVNKKGELIASSIYHWFEEDFGGSEEGVITHLKQYAKANLKSRLKTVSEIEDHDYDWNLNGVEKSLTKKSYNTKREKD
jgi:hypothetical protein